MRAASIDSDSLTSHSLTATLSMPYSIRISLCSKSIGNVKFVFFFVFFFFYSLAVPFLLVHCSVYMCNEMTTETTKWYCNHFNREKCIRRHTCTIAMCTVNGGNGYISYILLAKLWYTWNICHLPESPRPTPTFICRNDSIFFFFSHFKWLKNMDKVLMVSKINRSFGENYFILWNVSVTLHWMRTGVCVCVWVWQSCLIR